MEKMNMSLVVKMARHIKQLKKKYEGNGDVPVSFGVRECDNGFAVSFGGKEYKTRLSCESVNAMIAEALRISGDYGLVGGYMMLPRKYSYTIEAVMHRKPCRAFGVFSRALEKKSGFKLGVGDVKTVTSGDGTNYLCHDEERCNEALYFLRGKTAKDGINVKVVKRENKESTESLLAIEITSPSGRRKAYKEFGE